MGNMKRLMGGLVIFICLIVISVGGGTDESEKFRISEGAPFVLTHDLEEGMEALLEGVLKYDDETKCFTIENLDNITVPLWPKGTTAYTDNDLHGVEIPEYGIILEGDTVEGGGGGVDVLDIVSDCLEKGMPFAITQLNK